MPRTTIALLVTAILHFVGGPAEAVTLTQDRAAFNAATAGFSMTTENFNGVADRSFIFTYDAGPFTVSNTGGPFFVGGPGRFSFGFTCPGGGKCINTVQNSATIRFDTPVNAVGFLLGGGGNNTSRVLVNGADVGSIRENATGSVFVGLHDLTTPFTTVRLPGPLAVFEIDNVTFGVVAPVPAPEGLPLLVAAIAGLGLLRRRTAERRRQR